MKILLVSLGCDKNRVDSEKMLGLLENSGFSFTDDEYEADIIIINTCCFIDDAKMESIDTILEMAQYKDEGNCRYLFVAGCMAQRYQEEILVQFPEVDGFLGTTDISQIVKAVKDMIAQDEYGIPEDDFLLREDSSAAQVHLHDLPGDSIEPNLSRNSVRRVITTPGHFEFLKIAEGCNKRCTYCIIPYIRGAYHSFPMEELLEEAKELADSGVKELMIVAQETSIYGRDLYGHDALPELLEKLCRIESLKWIRMLYCYPEDITEEFLEVMAREPKICKYIDMPIQHASDKILKRMGRRTRREDLVEKINLARQMVPGIAIRTTLISGFPGEDEEDHAQLVDFVKEMRFDRLGVFPYSREEGTPAYDFEDQVEEDVKLSRRDDIMSIQELISYENLTGHIGETFDVLVDGYLPEDDVYVGRTYMDAPDVDGAFFFRTDRQLLSGDYVKCVATNASNYDLYGEICEDEYSE